MDNEPMLSEAAQRSPRRENREIAVQFLYQWSLNTNDLEESLEVFFQERPKARKEYKFAETLIRGVVESAQTVDANIEANIQNWAFNRIAKIDLAILRLAVYELLYCTEIPPVVTINEAIDISKVYSSADARRFVNGVLDKIKAGLNRPLREGC